MFYIPEQANNTLHGLNDLLNDHNTANWSMVEIGSFAGVSSALFATRCKEVFCIDPWQPYPEIEPELIANAESMFDLMHYEHGNIYKLRGMSLELSKNFPDKSLDFVYIDGAHDEKAVEADIVAWLGKIKDGGYIGGHDINIGGVQWPVNRLLGTNYKTYSDTSWIIQVRH